jgi:hypothetical protein
VTCPLFPFTDDTTTWLSDRSSPAHLRLLRHERLTGISILATAVYRGVYFSVAEVEFSGLRSNRTQ